jgi:intergrase/recombinase
MMRFLAAIGIALVRSSFMEQSNYQVSSQWSLERFVASALGELEKVQYSRRSLQRYRKIWRHLMTFCHEMNLGDEYSAELAAQFLNAHQMREGDCLTSRGFVRMGGL